MRVVQRFVGREGWPLSRVEVTHCEALKLSLTADPYVSNNLIRCYLQCGQLINAQNLFDEMPHRDTVSWNTIISGYVRLGSFLSAWEVFRSMKRLDFVFDGYTFGSMLKGIANGGSLICGQQVHSDVVKMRFEDNVYAASSLLDMYAKYCRVECAAKVFRYMTEPNSVSWNALIGAYVGVGDMKRCIELFISMETEGVRVDDATFAPLLTLIAHTEQYELMRQLHGKIMKHGLEHVSTVLNATITAYADCGCIQHSMKVFDSAEGYRDLVTWNSMLAAFLESDLQEHGFRIFLEMMRVGMDMDAYTCCSVLCSCSGDIHLSFGKSMHGLLIKRGFEHITPIANSLMHMYLKSSSPSVESAYRVFHDTHVKDRISWNTILNGLSQNGLSEDALRVFKLMLLYNIVIDQYAFAAVLRPCSDLATVQLGRQIHALVVKSHLEQSEYIASALIFMYSKCGMVEDSWKSFEASPKESSVTWNSIIFAYAQHGQGTIALDLFNLMKMQQVNMDHITFVAVINACSHIGLVDEGLDFLKSMETRYGVPPRMENFACTIDLLGRAGRLDEAKELIRDMPFQPDIMVWKTLLGSCRACGDIESATEVASHILQLDPGDHCTYVLLSDMYGNLKRWDAKANMKRMMRNEGIKKVPGWSWIELHNKVHAFNAEDHSHPHCLEIYKALTNLTCETRVSEYLSALDILLDDQDLSYGYWNDFAYGIIQREPFL